MRTKHKHCDNPYLAIGETCREDTCEKCHWNGLTQENEYTRTESEPGVLDTIAERDGND